MAIITASYPGNCSVCRQRYVAGTQINWTKGGPTSHVACSGGASSPSTPKSPARGASSRLPRPRKQARAIRSGETEITNRTGYTVGSTIHAAKVREVGGGPDGHYWHVVHAFFVRANEDMGDYDDLYHAYVRPATEEECAPIVSATVAKGARKACEMWLAAQLAAPTATSVSDTGRLPPSDQIQQSVVIGRKVGASGAVTDGGTTYALTETEVISHHNGYYDDYRSTTATVTRTSALAQVITALASGDTDTLAVCADRARLEIPSIPC
jgi:hypothetical protein